LQRLRFQLGMRNPDVSAHRTARATQRGAVSTGRALLIGTAALVFAVYGGQTSTYRDAQASTPADEARGICSHFIEQHSRNPRNIENIDFEHGNAARRDIMERDRPIPCQK